MEAQIGEKLNLGWTIGEEVLFSQVLTSRREKCRAITEACVLGFARQNLKNIKAQMTEAGFITDYL